MKKIFLFIFSLLGTIYSYAQDGVAINTAGTSPDASAVLDVSSTTQGMLVPRMTLAQRNSITSPATGLLIYQIDGTAGFYYNSGTSGTPVWSALGALVLNDLGDAKTTASDQSVFIGSLAGNGTSGTNNVGLGYNALNTLSTGTGNTAVGAGAGSSTTGNDNVLIGKSVLPSATGANSELNIGDAIYGSNLYSANANIGLGNGNNAPDASALLDMSSTTMGLLIPQMTQTQRDLIGTPATGLMIYQTDGTAGFYHYNGSAWVISAGGGAIDDLSDALASKPAYSSTLYLGGTGANLVGDIFFQNGNFNTYVGIRAGEANTTGRANIGLGYNSLNDVTTGYRNTGIGVSALALLTDGVQNTALGNQAGLNQTTGDQNIIIGYNLDAADLTGSNQMNIGDLIYGTNVYNATGNVGIGNGNNAPDASSVLDIASTTAGMLMPRMTLAQRDAISSPATGLMIYQTDATAGFYYWDGTAWTGATGAKAINDLTDGKTIYGTTNSIYLGKEAGLNLTTGSNNTALGTAALRNTTTGSNNIAIGHTANLSQTTASYNISIGAGTFTTANQSNRMNIANVLYGTDIFPSAVGVGVDGRIGINQPVNDVSAILEVTSTQGGVLIPRMTMVQRDAITTPATSLMIYQTDNTSGFYYYDGAAWTAVQDGVGAQVINDLTDGKTAATTSLYLGSLAGLSATGVENVGLGYGNLVSLTSGTGNTAIGAAANNALTTGTGNIGIGVSVNTSLTTGSDNIVIGRNSTVGATTSNALILGDAIYGTGLYGAAAKIGIGNGNNAPASTLDVKGSVSLDYSSGGSATLGDLDYTYATSNGATVTLPTAVGITGRVYIIKLVDAGTATVATTSSQFIDGSGTYLLSAQYKYVQVQSTGTKWIIIGQN